MKRYPACRTTGKNSASKQRFVGVDITDSDHNSAIHDEVFDRRPPPPGGRKQHLTTKCPVEWLRPEMCQLRGTKRIAPHPKHTAKAARIMESQYPMIREYEINVIVLPGRKLNYRNPFQA